MNEDENELKQVLNILHQHNVVPALSCGMHPGIVNAIIKRFGNDFMANCGGSLHGHPGGTIKGAMAMKQAIEQNFGVEYEEAIQKWGYVE
jgi:ribulose 1,5-bisphosphate carboxylase large subunit-like protein